MVQRMTSPGYQAPPRPAQTNCTQYSNQVSCRTQPTGIDASIYNTRLRHTSPRTPTCAIGLRSSGVFLHDLKGLHTKVTTAPMFEAPGVRRSDGPLGPPLQRNSYPARCAPTMAACSLDVTGLPSSSGTSFAEPIRRSGLGLRGRERVLPGVGRRRSGLRGRLGLLSRVLQTWTRLLGPSSAA